MNKKFLPSLLCACLATALFGCGDKNQQQNNTESAKAGEQNTANMELADKQEITINNSAEPESLDPHKVSGVPESNIIRQMLVGLTTTDDQGQTVPGMAESWESADNKVWVFKLRDAKWSNGDPVTAHDFEYSFKRLTDPMTASPYATYLPGLKVLNAQEVADGKMPVDKLGVRAIDDKTLEITLSEPVPYFPNAMFHTSVKPVNKKAIEQHGDKWTAPGNYVVDRKSVV